MNKKIVLSVFSIALVLFLLLLSYKAVLFFTALTPIQEDIFHFLEGKQGLTAGFTEAEVFHLEDVTQVMRYADYVFYLLLLLLTGIITYYRKDQKFLSKLLGYGGKITILVMVLVGICSLFFFDTLFTLFHTIFFPQGNWIFAADSMLIQTFPLEFFVKVSRNIFIVTLFLGIIFILLGHCLQYVRGKWD